LQKPSSAGKKTLLAAEQASLSPVAAVEASASDEASPLNWEVAAV